jgi:hypothetical protein
MSDSYSAVTVGLAGHGQLYRRRAGRLDRATSGDYDRLLAVTAETVNVE